MAMVIHGDNKVLVPGIIQIVVCFLPANEKQIALGMQENQNTQNLPVYPYNKPNHYPLSAGA